MTIDFLETRPAAPNGRRRGRPRLLKNVFELAPRERQVAELVALGYNNPQIAAELTITRETVKTHVGHILSKLGACGRGKVAGLYRQGGNDDS